MSEIYVSDLITYPIKSCGGIHIAGTEVGPRGLDYDREWMVTRKNGTFLSQRVFPQLALVETEFDISAGELVVSAPSHGTLNVSLHTDYSIPEVEVEVFKKAGAGRPEGDEAAEFFSEYLGTNAMLLRNSKPREVRPEVRIIGFSQSIGFADGAPILLTSKKSLEALQSHSDVPIEMNRFRPNIVVNGDGLEPYEEDNWRGIRIGGISAAVAWACARCPVPNVNQSMGVLPKPFGRFVTRALEETRQGLDPFSGKTEVFFGQNVVPKFGNLDMVTIYDPVTVISRSDSRNFTLL